MTDLFDGALTLHGLVGGRGAKLNDRPFKLTVDTTQPSSPEIGDVWLDTDLTVNQVVLSYDKPSGGQNGDAEIRISKPGFEIYGELATILDIDNATRINYAKDWGVAVNYSDASWNGKFPIALIKDLITVFAKFGIARVRSAGEWIYVPGSIWDGTQWQIFSSFDWDIYATGGGGNVARVDSDGNILDIKGHSVGTYPITDIAIQPDRTFYLTTGNDDVVVKFDSEMNQSLSINADGAWKVGIDPDNDIYVIYQAFIEKFTSTGQSVWQDTIGPSALDIDKEGFVYVTHGREITKYSPTGDIVWNISTSSAMDSPIQFLSIGPDDVFYIGSDSAYIMKFNTDDGSQIWLNEPSFSSDSMTSLAIDAEGFPYIGTLLGVIAKLDPANGDPIWDHRLGIGGSLNPTYVSVDPDNYVYAVNGTTFLAKYDPDGQLLWEEDIGFSLRRLTTLPGKIGAFPERW